MSYEDKVRNISEINETYNFASYYSDAADAAANIRTGYDEDPNWFGFEVEDEGDWWEEELTDLIAPYFAKEIELHTLDEVSADEVCVSEGQVAPRQFIIIDCDYCIGEDGCKYQLCDQNDAHIVMDASFCAPKIISKVSDDHYTVIDVNGNEREFNGLYINYAEDGRYKAGNVEGDEVYEALKKFKEGIIQENTLTELSEDCFDDEGNSDYFDKVAWSQFSGDTDGEDNLFLLMYNYLYSDLYPYEVSWEADICRIANFLGYEYVCYYEESKTYLFYNRKNKESLIELSEDDVEIIEEEGNWHAEYNGKNPDATDNEEITYGPYKFEELSIELGPIAAAEIVGMKYVYISRYKNCCNADMTDYYFWY